MEELLDILLTAGAPSGYEGAVQDIFRERMGRYVDRVEGTEEQAPVQQRMAA